MEPDPLVAPRAGDLVDLGGIGVHFTVPGALTGGAFSVVEHPVEPGVVVEPHTHQNEDELSYVLEGTIWARIGDREVEAPAGSYVWKPRGVMHTFWNPGPQPARILEIISPAGFERFFAELAGELARSDEPDEQAIGDLCDRYGLTLDRTWLPDIQARFGPLRMV
jgi:quercetin dioxygenase-like cupin family protein